MMEEVKSRFITAKEIAEDCGVGLSKAYQIIRILNKDLEAMHKITLRGRINRRFYNERMGYGEHEKA